MHVYIYIYTYVFGWAGGETLSLRVGEDAGMRDHVPRAPCRREGNLFMNPRTRPLHASEEDETRRQGSNSL